MNDEHPQISVRWRRGDDDIRLYVQAAWRGLREVCEIIVTNGESQTAAKLALLMQRVARGMAKVVIARALTGVEDGAEACRRAGDDGPWGPVYSDWSARMKAFEADHIA